MTPQLVSEKLDGIRAIWTGSRLLTRSMNEIKCPGWFLRGLPATPFEAELYAGPGTLGRVQGLARRTFRNMGDWSGLTLNLYDLPDLWAKPFVEVVEAMRRLTLPEHARVIPQRLVDSAEAVWMQYHQVRQAGGEGLILREPGTTYHVTKLKERTEQRWQRYELPEEVAA